MFCKTCNLNASVLCCSSPYCDTHFNLHLKKRAAHSPEQLLMELDPLEQKILNSELNLRIKQLESLKAQILTTLKVIIDFHNLALSQIIKRITTYKELLNSSNFIPDQFKDNQVFFGQS